MAVRQRIRDAIQKIGEQSPALGQRLASSIRTGTFCSYRWVPEPSLPLIGATSGTVVTRTCPIGEHLTGWLIGESSADVTSVQPICRRFL